MEYKRADFLYIRSNGVPRNFREPEVNENLTIKDSLNVSTIADVEAFKRTQRWLALGIVAVGGGIINLIDTPQNARELVSNLSVPVVIQGMNYFTFRKGISLMRRRAAERSEQ